MKILLINKFLYPKGGDAISVIETGKLLKSKGHDVAYWGMKHPKNPSYSNQRYFVDNIDFNVKLSTVEKIKLASKVIYSLEAKRKIKQFLKVFKPDIVHLHNFAHQISPSVLDVFAAQNIPMVMTMHDYKIACPTYNMLSNQKICQKCRNGQYYWCLLQKCNKGSYSRSLANTLEMYLHHRILKIYDKINTYIAPSKFLQGKIKDSGLKYKIEYLPNFIKVDNFKIDYKHKENCFVYFGRLSKEKGLLTLIDAVAASGAKLKIIGDGPLRKSLEVKLKDDKLTNISYLGYKKGRELENEIKSSFAVVLPSKYYENNPRSILESFALAKPVIGTKIGGIPELIKEGETGLTFELENREDLRDKINYFIENKELVEKMGRNARRFIEENYQPEKHYQKLMDIYKSAIGKHKS